MGKKKFLKKKEKKEKKQKKLADETSARRMNELVIYNDVSWCGESEYRTMSHRVMYLSRRYKR